ncbi:hypothetical protein OF83DRAFT_1118931 [Amylostereum chailletii]|nr:hypothetical protein OF83DRAFT_1118931 [Amylostereum chailletii]
MSRQDKATTEKHTRQLRELLKRPENKVCADCKHNDPRWASWNLGVYLCIRCSGIHRGMGTHISKVKSIDLDTWTPEQMESITKWGNRRSNLYWEAHLKPGHIPPDHKMESFIRSKYESRRWAMDGPPPADPSVLEGAAAPAPEPAPVPAQAQPPRAAAAPARRTVSPALTSPVATRQPQAHQLLSAQHVRTQSAARAAPTRAAVPPAPAAPAPSPAAPAPPQNDLFSLDFHAPPVVADAPKKDVKQDILSLFSTPAPQQQQQPQAFGAYQASPSPWGQPAAQAPPFSNAPTSAPNAAWNPVGFNNWAQPAQQQQPVVPTQANMWGQPVQAPVQQQQAMFSTNDIWASPSSGGGSAAGFGGDLFGSAAAPASAPAQKKDDVFGDLWGGFK